MGGSGLLLDFRKILDLVIERPLAKGLIFLLCFSPKLIHWATVYFNFATWSDIKGFIGWTAVSMFLLIPFAWFAVGGINLGYALNKSLSTIAEPKNFINFYTIFFIFPIPFLTWDIANDYLFNTQSIWSFIIFTILECGLAYFVFKRLFRPSIFTIWRLSTNPDNPAKLTGAVDEVTIVDNIVTKNTQKLEYLKYALLITAINIPFLVFFTVRFIYLGDLENVTWDYGDVRANKFHFLVNLSTLVIPHWFIIDQAAHMSVNTHPLLFFTSLFVLYLMLIFNVSATLYLTLKKYSAEAYIIALNTSNDE